MYTVIIGFQILLCRIITNYAMKKLTVENSNRREKRRVRDQIDRGSIITLSRGAKTEFD